MFARALITASAIVAMGGAAFAADLPTSKGAPVYAPPPPPIFTWTGVYIGGQIGYQWGTSSTFVTGGALAGAYPNFGPNGIIGGGHVGYNYQMGQFVAGLEGDVNGSSAYGTGTFGALTATAREPVDGSIRARVGVAWDRALVYATGGVAFGDFTNTYTTGLGTDSLSATRVGWTVGGGIEYAIDNNWSVRGEYRYTDFGRFNEYSPTALVSNVSQRETDSRVEVGFSYKFDLLGAPVVAKY